MALYGYARAFASIRRVARAAGQLVQCIAQAFSRLRDRAFGVLNGAFYGTLHGLLDSVLSALHDLLGLLNHLFNGLVRVFGGGSLDRWNLRGPHAKQF